MSVSLNNSYQQKFCVTLNLFLFKCQYVLPSLMTKTPGPENLCFELSSPLKEYLKKMEFVAGMSYYFGAVEGTEPDDKLGNRCALLVFI